MGNSNDIASNQSRLFSRENIKWYIGFSFLMLLTIAISLLSVLQIQRPGPGNQGPGQSPPGGGPSNPTQGLSLSNLWPLWGSLEFPTFEALAISLLLVGVFVLVLYSLYKRNFQFIKFFPLVLVGVFLIIMTNMIDGWATGIEFAISGAGEIYTDALNIVNPLEFISSYESIQPTLTTHAQTQPPGAVLTIYLFSVIFSTPGLIAIGISAVSGIFSAFFVRGLLGNWFSEEVSNYTTLLYLLLPAVQIYYLANIYAIVATLALGAVYFYLHENAYVSSVLTTVLVILGTFVSFLFVWVPLFFIVHEILSVYFLDAEMSLSTKLFDLAYRLRKLFLIGLVVGLTYLILYLALDFNYITAFLYASSLENPNGFMLFSKPIEYFATRIQDILDIVFFFGPVLSVICYKGLKQMKRAISEDPDTARMWVLVVAAILSLGILFLTGAPKKGETARICMFILPFLLIPVANYLTKNDVSKRDWFILLIVIIAQTVVMQLIGNWVW